MEYYSALKKNEVANFSGLWMDLACITFSERGRTVSERKKHTDSPSQKRTSL